MLKKITVAGVVAIAAMLAVQVLLREGPPPSLVEPPSLELPDLDSHSERVPAQPTKPAARDRDAGVARVGDDARAPNAPPQASAEPPAAPDGSRRFIFDCGNGVTFAVRTVPGQATLFSPQALGAEVIRLPQAAAVSGARYAANGVSYWNKGGLATFEIRERTFADCTSNPGAAQTAEALRRGATFRAHGNNPAWLLEITSDNIELAVERDTRRLEFPYRAPAVAGTRTTYRSFVGTQELVVVIDALRCNDTTTGEQFESAVTVTFEGAALYGCGRAP